MRVALLFASWMVASCQSDLDATAPLAALDEPYFRCKVQPVLTKSCGALACHGDARRYFHVFSRNRMRAQGSEADRNAALTREKRSANLIAAIAMVDGASPDASWILKKPLDSSAG